MGNQQGKVSEIDIAWLAGFLDGEGCFDLQKAYAKGLKREGSWRPRIRVVNTDIPTLETVTRIMDGLQAGQHVGWRFPQNKRWATSWEVEVAGFQRGHRFLVQITPFLHTKKKQAEALLDFINLRADSGNGHRPYSAKELELLTLLRSNRR